MITSQEIAASKLRRDAIYLAGKANLTLARNNAPMIRVGQRNFAAGVIDRLTVDFQGSATSINTLLVNQLTTMRRRSRSLARNEPYFQRYLKLRKKNVIGPYGVTLKMRVLERFEKGRPIYDDRANAEIERAFADWSLPQNCTVRANMSRAKAEQLVEMTQAIDGECLIRLVENFDNPHGFAWQFIETDRLDETHNETLQNGNLIRMGIEFDQWGRAVAYHLWKRDPNDYITSGGNAQYKERERVPASQIIHRFDPIFPDQIRGVPELYSAILRLNHLGQYEEAEVIASRIAAGKMGFMVEPPGAEEWAGDGALDDGTRVIDAEPGTMTTVPNGTEIKTFDPQHPNSSFESFHRAMMRGVACAADMSYHSLTGDLTAVNYSSARIGLLDERDGYMDLQQAIVDHLIAPSFKLWLKHALLRGVAALPLAKYDKFNAAAWRPRRWTWVDPEKEGNAAEMAISLGLKSRRQIIEESDSTSDPEEIWGELGDEKEKLVDTGIVSDGQPKASGNQQATPQKPTASNA